MSVPVSVVSAALISVSPCFKVPLPGKVPIM